MTYGVIFHSRVVFEEKDLNTFKILTAIFNSPIKYYLNFIVSYSFLIEESGKKQVEKLADQMKAKSIQVPGKNYYGTSKNPYGGHNKCGTGQFRIVHLKFNYLFSNASGAYLIKLGWLQDGHIYEVSSYMNLDEFVMSVNRLPNKLTSNNSN